MLSRFKAGLAVSAVTTATILALGATGASADPTGTLTPATHSFGNQIVGSESNNFNFVFTNTGDGTITLGAPDLTGPNPGQFKIKTGGSCDAGVVLAAAETCQVRISFKPTALNLKNANVSVPSDLPGSPNFSSVSGTAIADPTPAVMISSQILTFGDQLIGAGPTNPPLTIVVTNSGGGTLDLGAIGGLTGATPTDFAVNDQDCNGKHLAADQYCNLEVTFTPSAEGVRSAQFVVNPGSAASKNVNLSGVGIAPPVPPGTAKIKIAATLPKVKGRQLKIPFSCTVTEMTACKGKVKVTAKGKALGLKKYNKKKDYSVGTATVNAKSSTDGTIKGSVTVKLTTRAAKAIAKKGKLPVKITTTITQADGTAVTQKVARKAAKAAKQAKKSK